MLAGRELIRLLQHSVVRHFIELLLGVRVADRVVLGGRLSDLLYLARVVLYVLQHLVWILRF